MDLQPSSQLPSEPAPAEVTDDQAVVLPETSGEESVPSTTEPEVIEEAVEVEVTFNWQASEYIQHHKGAAWYFFLAVIILGFVGIGILFKLWLGIALFIVMGAAIAVYAKKEPRTLNYVLDGTGVTIETKHYPYHTFRSFAVFQDTEWHSIELDPTQRFMPRLTLLFSDADIDAIVDHLSLHLPSNDREPDVIERISRRLRF
jgi:hypothetical protein